MNTESKTNILFAIPNIIFAESMITEFKKRNYKTFDLIVDVDHILETLQHLKEQDTKVDAIILTSDIAKKLNDKRLELLSDTLIQIRDQYSHINIVVLANEKKGHPFLAEVVQMGIYNVFVKGNEEISVDLLEEVIQSPKTFSHAAGYLNVNPEYQWRRKATSIQPIPAQKAEPTTVIEKVIVKKEVNKQVIKRNFNINVQNNVEKVVGIPIDKKLILIGSPFPRSGSTFFSHLLARELAKMSVSVTYIESPYSPGYTYDRFIGHERNPDYRSVFYQYTKEIEDKRISNHDWQLEGINLVTKHPSKEPVYSDKDVPFEAFVKLLLATQSLVTIIDVGTDWEHEVYQDILDISSNAYFLIEPDICNIQTLEDPVNDKAAFYQELLKRKKSQIIGNHFDDSILKSDVMKNIYKDKIAATIPSFPAKDVFKCHYEGTFLNDMKDHQKGIEEALYSVIEDLLPEQFLKKYKKPHKGLFNGLFNKKISIEKEEK